MELGHDFGKGIGDAGWDLEQGKPVEMASLYSFLLPSGFFCRHCSLSSVPACAVSSPVPSLVTQCLLADFQPAWLCLEVVHVNVQRRHSEARDEIVPRRR